MFIWSNPAVFTKRERLWKPTSSLMVWNMLFKSVLNILTIIVPVGVVRAITVSNCTWRLFEEGSTRKRNRWNTPGAIQKPVGSRHDSWLCRRFFCNILGDRKWVAVRWTCWSRVSYTISRKPVDVVGISSVEHEGKSSRFGFLAVHCRSRLKPKRVIYIKKLS